MSLIAELDQIAKTLKNKQQNAIRFKADFSTIVSTWFFIGLIPIMPGTLASISVYPIYLFILQGSSTYNEMRLSFWFIAIILFIIGWVAVKKFQDATMTLDHKSVVIDEIIGQLSTFAISIEWCNKLSIALAGYIGISSDNLTFIIGFLAFRFFDIRKPLLIRTIDDNTSGAFGVIFDDIMAALFAAGTIFIIYIVYDTFF